MTDESENPGTEDAPMIADLYHRIRFMEQNLPPRVQNLEVAVSEIREEFRGMRRENLEAARESHQALNAFRKTLDRQQKEQNDRADKNEQAEMEIGKEMRSLGKKITFASGAFWAATALLGFIAYYWQKLDPAFHAATKVLP